jgi:hypothetical protein
LEEEYFVGEENKHRIQNENGCSILGYTEYRLPDGNLVRAHPNFRSEGPFYDWCIIPDPNDEYDYAVQHLIQNKRKVPDHFLRCPRLSKVEEKWGVNHLPSRVLAFYKHPETDTAMALVLPCRPWMYINENKSSTITEHWNVQSELRQFEMGTDGKLMEIDDIQNPRKSWTNRENRYVPMYHLVEVDKIKEVVFGIQENGPFSTCWKNDGGNVIIVSDRYTSWGNEFEDFTDD